MPNILLTKDDGLAANVPMGSITAIMSRALDDAFEGDEHPNGKCFIQTNFRGVHSYHLATTGRETAGALDAARNAKKGAIHFSRVANPLSVVIAVGEDASFFAPGAILAYEEIKVEGTMFYLVQYRRHDGKVFEIKANHTEENRATLNQATDTKENP